MTQPAPVFDLAGQDSRSALKAALACIDDAKGEGQRAFTQIFRDSAEAEATAADLRAAASLQLSPLDGVPVSVKDLFDVAGTVTTAGSKVLADSPASLTSSPVVERLRRAGAVIVGKTNMTEFAYSGLGINPHYGTPKNPWDRATGRIPGGSSSGAAVSVSDGMAMGAIGSDTGGSVRIPAALCGLVGYKPSQFRVPLDGAFPLSGSLDSIGPLAKSVDQCSLLADVMAGEEFAPVASRPLQGLRLAIPENYMLDGLDPQVAAAFQDSLTLLEKAGAQLSSLTVAAFDEIPGANANGGFAAAESFAIHRELLAEKEEGYDPRVSVRIARGRDISAADYIDLLNWRQSYIARVTEALMPYDALITPTLPKIAPAIAELETDDDLYHQVNLAMLRNPTVFNMADGCGVTLPCQEAGGAPVGLLISGINGDDDNILEIAKGIEALLAAR